MMNTGTSTYDETIHFHCVSTSTDLEFSNDEKYFSDIEDAKIFAEAKTRKFPGVWLWERGNFGRPGYEDVWVTYWWSKQLAEADYGEPEGRGNGWVNWMIDKVPADLKYSTHDYVPLDPKPRST